MPAGIERPQRAADRIKQACVSAGLRHSLPGPHHRSQRKVSDHFRNEAWIVREFVTAPPNLGTRHPDGIE
jgi:hypothetical protein